MKTYKIKNVELELDAEDIQELIKNNPELLEKKVSGRYFFPNVGEKYWCNGYLGARETMNNNVSSDIHKISMGNCYRTKEDCGLGESKQQAIVRCWKWQQENAPFEPDWSNENQYKYGVSYTYENNFRRSKLSTSIFTTWKYDFTLPHFKSEQDRDKFIEANKEDLLLLFTK